MRISDWSSDVCSSDLSFCKECIMARLDQRDMAILHHYVEEQNRELYWNYLAQHEGNDGYGLLALGVVRNDSMPGAVANNFAQNHARSHDDRVLTEPDWEEFGQDRKSTRLNSSH